MKKNQQEPLATMVIPSSNNEKHVARAVESLVAQTYSNLEIIVLDEGLSLKTIKSLRSLQKERSFKILRFAKNPDPFYGLNFALKKAKGKFVGIMEANDISFIDRIEKQVKFLSGAPGTVAVGGQSFLINKDGEVVGEEFCPCEPGNIYRSLFIYNPIVLSATLINRQLLPYDFVFFSGPLKIAADLELVFKLSQFGQLRSLNEKVIFHRLKETSLGWKNFQKTFLLISLTRKKALKEYSYKPSLMGWLCHWSENLAVKILPAKTAYFLYRRLGVRKIKNENQPGLIFGMKNVFTGAYLPEKFSRKLIFLLFSLFVFSSTVWAEENCGTQYGKEVCPTQKLTIDKKVWNPWEEKFIDNLADITPDGRKFVVGDSIYFRIRIKNEGSETVEKIKIEDILPSALKFTSGDLNFDIDRLAPGESEEKQVETKAVFSPSDCKAENVAMARFSDQEIRDTSRVCIVQEKAPQIEVLPLTGVSLGYYVLTSLIAGFLGLIIINLNKGEKNVR